MTDVTNVLISGGGIAGLTLGILLKEANFEPLVIEREPHLRAEGYMMDFFGSGWDVAERMGLVPQLRAIHYPIDSMQFVDDHGETYVSMPIDVVRRALGGKYVYLRRSDLEHILYERAVASRVAIRFGASIAALTQDETKVNVTFEDGAEASFDLVFGADGVHSKVRTLVFGDEHQFDRFLGAYVAAFHLKDHRFDLDRALKLYEETDRVGAFYPLDETRMDATFVFRHDEVHVPHDRRLDFTKEEFKHAGWILERVLEDYPGTAPIFFDTMTQIVMPRWHQGRVALVGDACGCLTLLAGQGSHMAMAGAYVLSRELSCHRGDHAAAFAAYQALLKPAVDKRQGDAALFAKVFIPSERSRPWLRRLTTRLMFNPLVLPIVFRWFGVKSVLEGYA
jgi:2-polyprenyl-6-methoxyphenol hydroxylase-like FAD-dependent oxidoreductase